MSAIITEPRVRLLPEVVITGANNAIGWKEGATVLSTTIPTGTYWCHNDDSLDSTYPSLYKAVELAMTTESTISGSSNSYVIEPATPSKSPLRDYHGLRIKTSGGGNFDLLDAGASVNILGQPVDYAYPGLAECMGLEGTSNAYLPSSGGSLTLPWQYHGAWRPTEPLTDGRRDIMPLLEASSEYPERADHYVLNRGKRITRRLVWDELYPVDVFAGRADDRVYAQVGQVGVGDDYNALEWTWLTLARGGTAILVYSPAGEAPDLQVDTHPYEVVKLDAGRDAFSDVHDMLRVAGEYYAVTLDVVVLDRRGVGY